MTSDPGNLQVILAYNHLLLTIAHVIEDQTFDSFQGLNLVL